MDPDLVIVLPLRGYLARFLGQQTQSLLRADVVEAPDHHLSDWQDPLDHPVVIAERGTPERRSRGRVQRLLRLRSEQSPAKEITLCSRKKFMSDLIRWEVGK